MKIALLLVLVLATSFAQAKNRYLVQFKSEQGYKAMQSYFNTTESSSQRTPKSLDNVQAMVLTTQDARLINSLRNHPEVAYVEPERFFPAPKPVNGFKISLARIDLLEKSRRNRKPNRPSSTPDNDLALEVGAATPWGIVAVRAGEAWAQSKAGQGVRVLVLDTGIDEEHPAIAPNFEKGRNFTEGADGRVDQAAYQDEEGHGTHCSGTILGAYNKNTGFTGVAPKAKLLMGRVCGVEGCSNIAVVEGINWGIQEKVDVISMSLGGPVAAGAERQAVTKADTAGIVVVAASGNGADAPTYSPDKRDPKCRSGNPFQPTECGVSFPAAFPTVVAVGAVTSDIARAGFSQWGPELDVVAPGAAVISTVPRGSGRESSVTLTVDGQARKVKSSAFSGTELFATPVSNSLVAIPGVGKPEDFAGVNVEGKFALVARGEIKFADKVKNAIEAKAAGVIIYNNKEGLMQGSLSEDGTLLNIPVVMIEKTSGEALVADLTRGATVEATVKTTPADYASFDGTSMATPHVAGVVALIKAANKSLTPAQVRSILASTAKPLSPNDTNQYGAGIVQADLAVQKAVGQ